MKKRILITTATERATRILLRSELTTLLCENYDVIVASPAENSKEWRYEFKDRNIKFLNEIQDGYKGIALYKHYGIDLVLSAENNDVPDHKYDVSFQSQAVIENVPVICLQTFIDTIFHPMRVIPDKYITWGRFFKKHLKENRTVLLWDDNNGCISGHGNVEGMVEDSLDISGCIQVDEYSKCNLKTKEEICNELELDQKKPILLYTPNGDFGEWVFEMADDYFSCAREFESQVIVKSHPIRQHDSWIYNILASKYPETPFRLIKTASYGKGTAKGATGYADNMFKRDKLDSEQMINLFKVSDIICSCASTANLKSMIFDKPNIINVSHWNTNMPIRKKMFDWYRDMIGNKYKACDLAKNDDHLRLRIEQNLMNPSKNKEGRAKLVKDFFGDIDGKAGQRAFNIIDKYMKRDNI